MNFSKYANHYDDFSIIQKIVAKACVNDILKHIKQSKNIKTKYIILDIGCGSGFVCKNIQKSFEVLGVEFELYAIDASANMLKRHPKGHNIYLEQLSFDDECFREFLKNNKNKFDYILSSSALQWSKNLSLIIQSIKQTNPNARLSFGLFSSNTFKTIYSITNQTSPILSAQSICSIFADFESERINYNLEFESKRDMFRYIKKSGVSLPDSYLPYKKAKFLYNNYNINYLEFEVIYANNLKDNLKG